MSQMHLIALSKGTQFYAACGRDAKALPGSTD
jgi:hypothetical protein